MAALGGPTLVGCTESPAPVTDVDQVPEPSSVAAAARSVLPVSLDINVGHRDRKVPVDTAVSVGSTHGTIQQVSVRDAEDSSDTTLRGRLSDDATSWTATDLLEPGVRYSVVVHGKGTDGQPRTQRATFRTQPLALDQQTYASVSPLKGDTVGVGMPVVVTFDVPVSDRASIERHLHVESQPAVTGSWHWVSDQEVHYRPRTFWESGTRVSVDADINGVGAGGGIYGQEDRHTVFTVGDSVISRINVDRHRMRVFVNDTLARTIPVTSGAPGTETRDGTKIIIEKFVTKDMDAATTGISPSDPGYYNIADVRYAMRVTYSGEFVHAAPWSVGSQGSVNVSHGCVGMSTDNARWLYDHSHVGDVVEVVGSGRRLEENNGWTDWNQPFREYRRASALH